MLKGVVSGAIAEVHGRFPVRERGLVVEAGEAGRGTFWVPGGATLVRQAPFLLHCPDWAVRS